MVQRVSRERRQAFCHWDQTQLSMSGVQLQSRAATPLVGGGGTWPAQSSREGRVMQ